MDDDIGTFFSQSSVDTATTFQTPPPSISLSSNESTSPNRPFFCPTHFLPYDNQYDLGKLSDLAKQEASLGTVGPNYQKNSF